MKYFDAPAGAGKTRALTRYADRLALRGKKVVFAQPTKHLIAKTVEDELLPLDPPYGYRAIHGDADLESDSVVGEIIAHFKQAVPDKGQILFITHAALLRLQFLQRKAEWILLMDEAPQVDVFEELNLPETSHLITPYLELVPGGAAYGLLRPRKASSQDEEAGQ